MNWSSTSGPAGCTSRLRNRGSFGATRSSSWTCCSRSQWTRSCLWTQTRFAARTPWFRLVPQTYSYLQLHKADFASIRLCEQTWRSCGTSTWRERRTATPRSAKAAGRWTAIASGSPATGRATLPDASTTSGAASAQWDPDMVIRCLAKEHLECLFIP